MSDIIAPGTQVPDFALTTADGERFTPADLRGKTTVLVFYPSAFSPVCTDQMQVYEEALPELVAQGATLYGVSTDHPDSQQAFKEKLGISIEQLSDFEPKGRWHASSAPTSSRRATPTGRWSSWVPTGS